MKWHLRWKLMLTYLVMIFVGIASVEIYLGTVWKRRLIEQTHEELVREAMLIKAHLEPRFSSGLANPVDEVVDALSGVLEARVTVVDAEGAVRGDSELDGEELRRVENHSERPEIVAARRLGVGQSVRYSTTLRTDMMYVAVAMESAPRGVVRLALPLWKIVQMRRDVHKALFWASLGTLVLVFALSYVVSAFLSRPIRQLTQAARRMSGGDFSTKLHISSRDELGVLASALEEMVAQWQARVDEIAEAGARTEAVLDGMTEGVLVVDAGGRILRSNLALRSMVQPPADVEGESVAEVIRSAVLQEALDRVLETGEAAAVEIALMFPAHKTLEVSLSPIRVGGVVAVFHDATERRRLERVRRDFVANVSHELRTPLTAIKGYVETLLDGGIEDQKQSLDFLRVIQRHGNRLGALLGDLLELARIESGEVRAEAKAVDLRSVALGCMQSVEAQAAGKRVTLNVDLSEDIPPLWVAPEPLERVLTNVLDNAVKYNREGGSVTVEALAEKEEVQVRVRDTGVGIPSSELPRIFERFYRVDKSRSRALGGTGLGLSIVKHLVEGWRGRVWAESVLNQGSTFYFTVPRMVPEFCSQDRLNTEGH
ncbi:MAG: ATP-binding protein [Candidatus Latescibacterota bacterium]